MRIDTRTIKRIDKSSMLESICEFPLQIRKGWDIGTGKTISLALSDIDSIVFSGMGGSAIAGDLVKSIAPEIPVPFVVNRSYTIPVFTNAKTLFIVSSYSGNTEETLSALKKAMEKKCQIICITSGGEVESIGRDKGFSVYKMEKGYQPRAALGFSLGIIFSLLKEMGCKTISYEDVEKTAHFLEDKIEEWQQPSQESNISLQLAEKIKGKIPLLYGSVDTCAAVAHRWKTQLNENSKTHAFVQSFSEMNHNEIVGWEVLPETSSFFANLCAIFLKVKDDLDRNLYRMDITKSLIEDSGVDTITINAEGFSFFSRMMYLIVLGDFVSFYLAVLYGIDPTEIEKINILKKYLKKRKE
ncbi:MAG: bifunctional phosphoglucose/phosphomannose isomerase [bacterium]